MKEKKVVFKEYNMYQLMLPMDLSDLIPESHLVRLVNEVIERMKIENLIEKYPGGGCSSYNPKMMLKVLVYAYCEQIYTSRKIAKALRENINFMWLSGNNRPDFRTINRFRTGVMKELLEKVFNEVLNFLISSGYVKLENYFLDGTKIEANANKYSYVWKKSTKRYKEQVTEKIKEILIKIDKENIKEDDLYGNKDLPEVGEEINLDATRLEEKIKEIEEKLNDQPEKKEISKELKKVKKEYLPRLKKYEEQEKILGERNSYSKTDKSATFMRMKEDSGNNPHPKAAYNVQIGTENQFILGYSIHEKPGDTTCFIPHLEELEENLGRLPNNVITDAGYGSEENYEYLEKNNIGNYVKYNTFYKEQKDSFKEEIFRVENLFYDHKLDEYICPYQRRLKFIGEETYKTENGYNTSRRIYECENCSQCELKTLCTKARGNRKIQVSFRLNELKAKAKSNLCSSEGIKLRSKRSVEVETVFGRIKNNWSFRRFFLRGYEKVKIEWGLLSIAHNITKLAIALR